MQVRVTEYMPEALLFRVKDRQDYRHQRFIYRSVVAVKHKQYSYADVAQTFTERQTYNHGCKEGYERI